MLVVQDFYSSFLGYIAQSYNAVLDSLGLSYADPADLRCRVAVSSAASFSINRVNVYYAKFIARHNTSLVERKAELLFSF